MPKKKRMSKALREVLERREREAKLEKAMEFFQSFNHGPRYTGCRGGNHHRSVLNMEFPD